MLGSGFSPMAFLKKLFLACFLCSCLCIETPSQACDPNDLQAMKEFAGNLTNGSIIVAWSNGSSSCCEWDGVGCDNGGNESVSSRVTMLNLSGKGLRGSISPSLGRLNQLKFLDLSNNHLEGGLPVEISNLKELEVVDLSHNMLTGPVTEPFLGLSLIRSLNVSGNSFTGEFFDLGGFPSLAVLNLSSNSFTGELSTKICNASKELKSLDLSMNRFFGGLDGLANCIKSLQGLRVDGNLLSGHIPEFLYSLPHLEELSIAANKFSGQLSPRLGNLSSLRTLIVFGNHFSGPIPNVFDNLTQLEQLVAHSNKFNGSLPSSLSLCPKLRVLDLRNNSLSGSISLDFTKLHSLCTLDLATNHFSGPLPDSLSTCQELKIVSLAKNALTGQVPESYANLTSLIFLSMSNNSLVNLSGSLSILQKCRNLSTLILTRNFHGEEMPENVLPFESLTVFALGNCALRGRIPSWLQDCRKLEVLDLSWNHLNGSIPPWIGHMENLFYMDFCNNSLTGELPKSLTELKSLIRTTSSSSGLAASTGIPLYVKRNQSTNGLSYNQVSSFPPSIYLSNNRINGSIWPEIGRLKQLHVLDLSRNNISGTIPASISDMSNLEVLDLSWNDLRGSIPASFSKLTFLSRFSVAYNHLQGVIPIGGQFLSFPNSSFEGNAGLCGTTFASCGSADIGPGSAIQSRSHSGRLGRSSILGITISIGVGITMLLAAIILKLSRRDAGVPVEDMDDEYGSNQRPSGAFGTAKLVLFQNSDCKDLSVADLLKSTSNFSQANIIGCGGFGLVYKAILPDGRKVAIKRLSGDCGQIEREFQAEVEALSRAQHKNLVALEGYCLHGNDRMLIYSYMENGSLDYWLHERVDEGALLNWDTRLKIAQGAGHGLAYLHGEPNIVHRDIKTSNILLNEKFEAHLADFGLSRLLHPYDTHVTTDLVGTLGYIPPEYSQTLTATFKGDVYSFGVVLLELLTSRRPVEVCKGKNCRDLVSWVFEMVSIKREEEVFDALLWNKSNEKQLLEVLDVACKCLDRDPRRRPTIDQVVSWLDDVKAASPQE